ncbi:MAG: glycosyltransferase family 2 protein, partial [Lactobacillus sp.]|nr:glycosyltransferase family 2 protein [Lactobacillus sp.]
MKKISIIIPVYNRERHLEECVNSILLSIENDVEIIIVDDGSTDGTSEICDKLKKKSKCVKVIHQPNKGVASARNTGLSAASGEWIAWVDSDDLVSASYIKTLKKCIASIDADIII